MLLLRWESRTDLNYVFKILYSYLDGNYRIKVQHEAHIQAYFLKRCHIQYLLSINIFASATREKFYTRHHLIGYKR